MNRKIFRCIAAFLTLTLFLNSCTSLNKNTPSETETASTDETIDNNDSLPIEKLDLLGDVTFIPDSEKAKETVFRYEETVLQVEDSSGLTWKLTIPAYGLLKEETVKMTPLKDVKDAQGRELSGVLLEPDGLEFIFPTTLTISGDGVEQGWIYCADHSGKNPEFVMIQQSDRKIEGEISHFSSAIIDKDPNLLDPEKKTMLDKLVKKYIPKVKKLLKDDSEIPEAPIIELECFDGDVYEECEKYKKKLSGNEPAYISLFYQAYCAYLKKGDPMAEEIKPLLNQLSNRLKVKIDKFFESTTLIREGFFSYLPFRRCYDFIIRPAYYRRR